jgi:hypothetical protein
MSTILVLLSFLPIGAFAQDEATPPHASSTTSPDERYEIVQSELAAKWTFRLDRFCGAVSQLVSTNDGGTAWERMPIEKPPSCVGVSKPHFQLFSSSLAARHTFLMDTTTGRTWLLVTRTGADQTTYNGWDSFEQ